MWSIELVQRHGLAIHRLAFDTKEDAELQYNKLKPIIGKERDYSRNVQSEAIELVDKFGAITVVPWEMASIRIFDVDGWEDMVEQRNIKKQNRKAEVVEDKAP